MAKERIISADSHVRIEEAAVLAHLPTRYHQAYGEARAAAMALTAQKARPRDHEKADRGLPIGGSDQPWEAAGRAGDPVTPFLVGEMENLLTTAQLARDDMVRIANDLDFPPVQATASAILVRKTIAANHVIAAVEKALEATGGSGFFRKTGLERLLRDHVELTARVCHPRAPSTVASVATEPSIASPTSREPWR